MPRGSEALLELVKVEIDKVEVLSSVVFDPESSEATGRSTLVAIQVTVKSSQDQPRLLVEPQRFSLEADTGESMPLRLSGHKQPILPTMYLPSGQAIGGWLTFQLLQGEHRYTLVADLRRPQIRLPVELPAS